MNQLLTQHTQIIDGHTMHYLDIGEGPVLLFGHSYLCDSTSWQPQLAELSQHYRCIVPDLWGHGQSDKLPASCRSLKQLAEQYLALLDSLNIDNFSMIGQGIGGMWGAELTLLAPARVNSLVMLGSFLGFEPEVSRANYYAMLDEINQTKSISADHINQLATRYFSASAEQDNPQLIKAFKQQLSGIAPERIDSLHRLGRILYGRRDIMEDIEQLTLPCLIMTGADDRLHPILEGYLMHDAIDGSQYIHLPHAGHMANLEQADLVNQHLLAFHTQHIKG
ncbi:alpha/beta fold hydrolase [Shewanella algidipiscicola]|uniref:2-succinyl-6-hydroxy-2, 4-cyclohexadiene-1-carboxy late synthase n=1 Tax=Shewanella algidipiscicola TaxID=614070 RepID=A0ABQ4PI16_9GAMM|nr:alpha/beta hydrolase [Shewanella algidipiscicola]GIU47042.1 2-succinyl-6-hydroxy-2,4-cyclohexadiene-1-carboxy late synthase [Shewanella algidipiscicola]